MTQTNTDYLLQITPAVTDRTYAAPSANGGTDRFDDHLSQAATFSGEDSLNRESSSHRVDAAHPDRDERSRNSIASEPNSSNSGSPSSSQTPPVDHDRSADVVSDSKSPTGHEQPADVVSDSKASSDSEDGEEDNTEKPDNSAGVEVAGASQLATINTKKTDPRTRPNTNLTTAAPAKAAVLSKKPAAGAGEGKGTSNTDGEPTSDAPSAETVTQHADEAAKLTATAATDVIETKEDAGEAQATGSDGVQSKMTKNDAPNAKSKKEIIANDDTTLRNDSSGEAAGTGEISPEVAQEVTDRVEASAIPAEAATRKDKPETVESWEDDSPTDSQNDSRPAANNEASVQAIKSDSSQVVVSAARPTEASANGGSKSKDDERATKPLTAKSEAAAAAFARMTRNSLTGSSDSASGANDLPPVDPSRFIGRVAKAFQTAQDRGGTLQLRLSPPELGALRIELNVKDGVMSASLQAENANARRLLLDHLPALRDRLAEQNIRVDRFDVDVRRDSADKQTDTRGSQQQQFQHQPDQSAPRRQAQPQPRTREIPLPERTVIAPSASDAGLNLIV